MGVFGHIMKFIMITLVVVLVIFIVAFAAMFFFPSFKLFGYHYIDSGDNGGIYEYLRGDEAKAQEEWDKADIIRIETAGYDLDFEYANSKMLMNSGDIRVEIYGIYRGFVKGSVEKPTYTSSNSTYDVTSENKDNSFYIDETRPDKKIYFIRMQEPEKGFLMHSRNEIHFIITQDAFKDKDVEIFTQGGNISFGADKMMSVNNLKIVSDSGSVYLNNMKINTYIEDGVEKVGNLEIIKSQKGAVKVDTNLKANVAITVNGGTDAIQLKNIESTEGDVSKLTINSYKGAVYIGDVDGDFSCNCGGAKLEAGNITGAAKVTVKETSCHFKTIGQTPNVDTLELEVTGKTNLDFEKVMSNIDVKANVNSTINVWESFGDVVYRQEKGNGTFNLKNAHASNINIVQATGRVNLDCNKDEIVNITSTATSGTIAFSGVEQGRVEINTANEQSGCSIIGVFEVINDKHTIKTTSGTINITAPQNDSYSIFWLAKSASIDIFGNLKTNAFSSEEYCKQNDSSYRHTTAYGEPCAEKLNGLDLYASAGKVVISKI